MNGFAEQITFLGLGATLAMMALGLVSAIVIPGIDRWNQRFFAAFFAVFLLGRITYTVDVMLYGMPGMEPVERAVWFLQSLLGSIPIPMFTFYLVHCYGEDWRRSALFRAVLAIWGLYVLLLCIGQFTTLFDATINWESRLRQDLRYPSRVTALLGITLLNLLSVIRRWGALPPKKRLAFLALLLPVPVIFVYLVFSASGLLFTDIGISLSALSMFFIILHDQVEQYMDPDSAPLRIRIATRRTGSGSEIVVEDNGAGFEPADDFGSANGSEPHVALENIRERLQIMCGGRMTITPREGGGTVVRLAIP